MSSAVIPNRAGNGWHARSIGPFPISAERPRSNQTICFTRTRQFVPPLPRRLSARRRTAAASWPVLGGLVAGNGLLNIPERRKQLLGIKLFRATAELRALRLALQMPQAVHLRQRLVALGDRAVADRLLARTEDENRSRERIVPELL